MAITTLTGKNSWLINQYVINDIAALSTKQPDAELRTVDCELIDLETLLSELNTQSLFSRNRIFKLRYIAQNPDIIQNLDRLLSVNTDQLEVYIIEPNLDNRSKAYKILKDKTNFKLFGELEELAMIDWIVDRAKFYKANISRSDARYLLERVGNNQLLCDNELNKLSLYKESIDKSAIDALIESTPRSKTFDLINAAFSKNYNLACRLYIDQRLQKIDPTMIIGLLAWQLHILATVSQTRGVNTSQMSADLATSPSVISRTAKIAQKISYTKVTDLINRLIYIDYKSKTSDINLDDALLNLIVTF